MTLPRLERYIAALPDGWASYPECAAKATLLHGALEMIPEDARGRLPVPLLARVAEPALPTAWAPEVEMIAMVHAAVDLRGAPALWDEVVQANVALFGRREYQPLVRTGDPARVIEQVSRSWRLFHRGTTFECLETAPGRAVLVHGYPPPLFPAIALRMRRASLEGVLLACGATGTDVHEEALAPGRTRYVVTWAVADR